MLRVLHILHIFSWVSSFLVSWSIQHVFHSILAFASMLILQEVTFIEFNQLTSLIVLPSENIPFIAFRIAGLDMGFSKLRVQFAINYRDISLFCLKSCPTKAVVHCTYLSFSQRTRKRLRRQSNLVSYSSFYQSASMFWFDWIYDNAFKAMEYAESCTCHGRLTNSDLADWQGIDRLLFPFESHLGL